ncbi:MAG: Crp/Fnr family transcriptional regulator [Azospirillaceae bacterium]
MKHERTSASDAAMQELGLRRLSHAMGLDGDEAEAIAAAFGPVRHYPRQTPIFEADHPCGSLSLLLDGWAQKYAVLSDGRKQIFSFELPGELVGLSHLHTQLARYTCEAVTDCVVLPTTIDHFMAVVDRHPSIAPKLLLVEERKSRILHAHMVNMGRRTAQESLAHLVLELEARLRKLGAVEGGSYALPLTQSHLADALGITEVHVNRSIRALRKLGMIDVGRGRVIIRSQDGVRDFAHFDADYLDTDRRDVGGGSTGDGHGA